MLFRSHLGTNYKQIVQKDGGWYRWLPENTQMLLNIDGQVQEHVIDNTKKYRETELGYVIANSPEAKEIIREAYAIPDMPSPEIEKEIAATNKKKRPKKSELDKSEE